MRLLLLRRFVLCLLLCVGVPLVYSAHHGGPATASVVPQRPPVLHEVNAALLRSAADSPGTDNGSPASSLPADVLGLEPDSIVVTHTDGPCGTVQGTVRFLSRKGSTPVGLLSISLDPTQSYNYSLVSSTTAEGSSEVDMTLTVIDPSDDAYAVVVIMDRAAQRVTASYRYTAEKLVAAPADADFGLLAVGAEKCRDITLTNPMSAPLVVGAVELTGAGVFSITSLPALPFTVSPGQSVTIAVCGRATGAGEFADSIRVQLSCSGTLVAGLRLRAVPVRVTMNDRAFGEVLVGSEQAQDVVIENISNGDVPVELYSVDWDDRQHFRTEGLENDKFPIVLPNRGDTYTFTVYYQPTQPGVQNSTVAEFTGNTTIDKTFSTWTGTGKLPVSVGERDLSRPALLSVAPQPLSGTGSVRYSLDFPASVVLSVYTMLGERVLVVDKGPQSAGEHAVPLDLAHLQPGLYLVRVDAGGRSEVRTVVVGE